MFNPSAAIAHACTVLVVEDDPRARKYIRLTLQKAGCSVVETSSGEEALDLFDRHRTQVALLDVGLPGMDGFELCTELRKRSEDTAILILTGRGEDSDKVFGLDLGADDYLVKPFGPEVLVARINAVLRRCRSRSSASDTLTLGDIRLEFHTLKVFKGAAEVDLTPREFALLATFLKYPGQILSREQIHGEVWGENHHGSAKALDVFICKLREKLEDDPAHPRHFLTQRGVGFVCQ
jgi:DNA-binding response OmpR family regulator